ncbi:binding-protein-dependent transport systems inner membrane component [Acidimicrobium ferrooxidans DSM 10331]|uniref:Binding-protein-dependent transport systems inner membrane component n=1 Tax=Acidimicrobium ferrooxidans (strain DSM 10331 / JCM 15462 / NBRC 103882 / ICP) TaxID=525909 RepID=C7M244_ACIFD|nr:binding-protein-dependent transport systems inner membrane component [Acidimicrobium ferrooxidans DSM 10331]
MSTPVTSAPAPAGAEAAAPVQSGSRARASLARIVGALWSNVRARIGIVILLAFVLMALAAPLIAPYSPTATSFADSLPPSAAHLLGTTSSGQDALSQLLYGARTSVLVAFAAGGISTVVAIVVGLIAGFSRGIVDETLSFVMNVMLVIPGLPLMIVITAYLPGRGPGVIIAVIALTGWAWGARVLRSQAKSVSARDFVLAARLAGDSSWRIVFREILPNMTSLIAASFFGAATAAVLAEAGLEFLGLGNPNAVSWGTMLYWAENSNALLTGQWGVIVGPGLCIALLASSLSLINFGVDALSNPRLRERA